MANARWQRDRERRDRMAAEMLPAQVVARVVVIVRELQVREFALFNFDGGRYCLKTLRAANRFALSGFHGKEENASP